MKLFLQTFDIPHPENDEQWFELLTCLQYHYNKIKETPLKINVVNKEGLRQFIADSLVMLYNNCLYATDRCFLYDDVRGCLDE